MPMVVRDRRKGMVGIPDDDDGGGAGDVGHGLLAESTGRRTEKREGSRKRHIGRRAWRCCVSGGIGGLSIL